MIRVLIADDHKIFVDGLVHLLAMEHNISIIAKAHTGVELIDRLKNNDIDVVLSDINMPEMNGLEASSYIVKHYPNVKVILLSMHNRQAIIKEVIKIGVNGYVLKSADNVELVNAINNVFEGKNYFSKEVLDIIKNIELNKRSENEIVITKKELKILKFLCEGFTSREIADKLGLSHYTVDTHRKNLLLKTKSKNVVSLVNYAYKNSLIDCKL